MKKQKQNFLPWILGSVAALIFLGSGSMAAAQVVTSYNDLAWDPPQLNSNITTFTSPNGGSGLFSSGQLKDFNTGLDTAVTLTITGGSYDGPANHATQGADPTTGDAFTIFDGKLNGQGVLSYTNAPGPGGNLVLTFTNMDPTKSYDLAFFGHRDDDGWDRASLVTISGQDAFLNTSSIATDNPDTINYPGGVLFTGPTSPSTRLPADNDNGYVARFSNVKSGGDGTVVLTISFDGTVGEQYKGKYGSAIRLIESGGGDIVWRNTTDGAVAVWLMNGLTINPASGSPGGAPNNFTIVGIGDLNGDGKTDLVWRDANTGDVGGWLLDGANLLSAAVITAAVPTEWVVAGVGDLDGDGNADIVYRNTTTGTVSASLMNGLVVNSSGIITPLVPLEWVIAGVGDLDGDGNADIVYRNTTTGTVSASLMNGLVVNSSGIITPLVPLEWVIAGVGDLDGDGNADIVYRNTTTGTVSASLMNGLVVNSSGIITPLVPLQWVIESVVDLDGDGNADIVYRNTTTGTVSASLMNGLVVSSSGVIAVVPLVWEIQP